MVRLLYLVVILLLSSCFQYDGSPPYRPYPDKKTGGKPSSPKFYPTYDPSDDNPYRGFDNDRYKDFQNNRYEYYPRYNPDADNPYYPPSKYIPPRVNNPYQYPNYNPSADNPYYPSDKGLFQKPMFDYPLFFD